MDEYASSVYYTDFDDDRGHNSKRYKPLGLDELVNRTKFTRKEVQLIYQGFKQECPSGTVNEDTFKHIYGQFFPFADTSAYAHLIFSTFDPRASGSVTFEDFLIALSTLCRGSIEDRLRWMFTLYDTKKSGRLTQEDFQSIYGAVYSLLGHVPSHLHDRDANQEHTAGIFRKFDKCQQGYITVQDFVAFCLSDSTIIQSIECLRSTV